MVKLGENLTLPWNISKTPGSEIEYIFAYFTSIVTKKIKIVTWGDRTPILLKKGRKIFGGRLSIDFNDNQFAFKIWNAVFNDSGSYSIKVAVEPNEKAVGAAIVIVQGKFFSYYQ